MSLFSRAIEGIISVSQTVVASPLAWLGGEKKVPGPWNPEVGHSGPTDDSMMKMADSPEPKRVLSIEDCLQRNSLPKLIQLASPKEGSSIDAKQIKASLEDDLSQINCFAVQGKDTLLHRLAENIDQSQEEHTDLIEFMIKNGAHINALNVNLETPLHISAKKNKYKLVNYLMVKNANPNLTNACGDTCLHLAVSNGCKETVAMLHSYAGKSLDEKMKNKHNFTALQIANQVEVNNDRLLMKEICEILETDPEKYRKDEGYKKYLKSADGANIWCLKPSMVFHIEGKDHATLNCAQNIYIQEEKASSMIQQPLVSTDIPGASSPVMMCSDRDAVTISQDTPT